MAVVNSNFAAELARLGPDAAPARQWSLTDAQAYCRRLARSHYENFTVASWLLPKRLRQPFCDVYAYCRWSDDLGDETAGGASSLVLLDWWHDQLRACYAGRRRHPVFVALAETIREFSIPIEPFAELLVAFRQDQVKQRYATRDELLAYCRYSANPVGRLVLYLGRCHDAQTAPLSDSICTGLQLANFWQDVARDWAIGRRYLPDDTIATFDCGAAFDDCRATPGFRAALEREVDRAAACLRAGLPLVALVPRDLRIDVSLFIQGGLAILQQIRRLDYDVWSGRPTIGRRQQLALLWNAWRDARRKP